MPRQFSTIKKAILGPRYELSVAFLAPAKMRAAMKYKKLPANKLSKTKTSNVLAFPLSKTSGEILLCKSAAKPYTVEFLFIHACLHLRGLKHGATMEREEDRLLKRFKLSRNG